MIVEWIQLTIVCGLMYYLIDKLWMVNPNQIAIAHLFGGFFYAYHIFIFKVEYTIIILLLGLVILYFRPKKRPKMVKKSEKPIIWYKIKWLGIIRDFNPPITKINHFSSIMYIYWYRLCVSIIKQIHNYIILACVYEASTQYDRMTHKGVSIWQDQAAHRRAWHYLNTISN